MFYHCAVYPHGGVLLKNAQLPWAGARLKQAADYVNAHYDVEGLQRELPARLDRLCDREGARIGK